jgi:outer membrane usher protein
VEVYVNDLLVRRERLFPGTFELGDVPASIGLGTADIVIKDVFGTERVISKRFFYSDRLLKRGLHEYSFGLGFVREDLGERSFSYGKPAFLAFHNYGFSEKLKGGYAIEASKDLINLGPTASLLVSKAGVLDVALSFSNSEGESGLGGFLGYFFRSRLINAALSVRSLSKNFGNIALKPSDDKPSFELTGVIGLNMKRHGSISAEYSTQRLHTGFDTSRYALSYNRVITRRATFFITASRTEPEDGDEVDEVFLSLHIYFGRDISGSLTHRERDGEGITTATVQKNLPVGTGAGFRAQAIRFEDKTDTTGDIQYQNDYGIYGVGYRDIGDEDNYTLSASGGIGYIGRSAFLSRPVTDSFAKVNVGGLEGVRVYYFGNEVGRTDGKGAAIVPVNRSFRDNRIDIEKHDIPIDYAIPGLTRYVNPPFRSGSVVTFDVTRIQGLVGKVFVVVEGRKIPVEFSTITIMLKDRTIEGLVGRDGEFYIENVPAGIHPAKIIYEGKECVFDITIPESEEMWVDLGEVLCEM